MVDPETAIRQVEAIIENAHMARKAQGVTSFNMDIESLETILPLAKSELARIKAKAVLNTAKEI